MSLRGRITRRPLSWRPQEPVSAGKLNQLATGLSRLDSGIELSEVPTQQSPYLQIFQGKLNFILGDYLQVRELTIYDDGTEVVGTTDILVAKPWFLRRTPFDGIVFNNFLFTYIDEQTRDATDQSPPGKTERQHITPPYFLDTPIYCARIVRGGTGVSTSLRALDLNCDARMWATDDPV